MHTHPCRLTIIVLATGITLLSGACGGDAATPAAPTPTVQSITVTSSSDLIFIGASETFAATAAMSSGGTQAVTGATWGSDSPSVASVDNTGRVTGVGSGMATIFVDFQGRRGTKLIRGLPNYQGAWSGSYAIAGCSHTGDFARANFCSSFQTNRVLPTNLNLTQDRDRVQGRFFLGTLGGDGSGPVQSNGQLLLSGAIQDPTFTIETNWSLVSSSAGRITGAFSQIWRGAGFAGDARVNADIRDLNRTSSVAVMTPPHSEVAAGDLRALIAALEGR